MFKEHPSYEQVMLDVNRCAVHKNRRLKKKLAKLIIKLLIKKSDLHYYQGFHDVCLTYMKLLGDKKALIKLDNLIDTHFKIFMQPTMNETQDFLAHIPIIIGQLDLKLQEFLEKSEVGTIFALSWTITWFSHVIPNEADVEKIFKFLEDKDPHMILYLCAILVVTKKDSILELEPEMSTVHHYLCQVPKQGKLLLDGLLSETIISYVKWSPEFIKHKLDEHKKAKLRVQNYNLITKFANSFGPVMSNIVTLNAKTAILVLVLASAFAFHFDRWYR